MTFEIWALFVVFCVLLVLLAVSFIDGLRERDTITLEALARAAEAIVEDAE